MSNIMTIINQLNEFNVASRPDSQVVIYRNVDNVVVRISNSKCYSSEPLFLTSGDIKSTEWYASTWEEERGDQTRPLDLGANQ